VTRLGNGGGLKGVPQSRQNLDAAALAAAAPHLAHLSCCCAWSPPLPREPSGPAIAGATVGTGGGARWGRRSLRDDGKAAEPWAAVAWPLLERLVVWCCWWCGWWGAGSYVAVKASTRSDRGVIWPPSVWPGDWWVTLFLEEAPGFRSAKSSISTTRHTPHTRHTTHTKRHDT
jgi:hypothetical protein